MVWVEVGLDLLKQQQRSMSALPSWRNLELRHEYMMMLIDELITEGEISVFFAFEQSDTNTARVSYSQSKCSLRDKIMSTGTSVYFLVLT